jgi:NAD(P)-dependent dehydrogenase (short-subunit alcohol dehydrogenase family)
LEFLLINLKELVLNLATMKLQGKVCLITGANSGIGFATAKAFAKKEAGVVMLCRNPEKGKAAQDEIIRVTGNQQVHLMIADLSSQQSIRKFVTDFKTRFDQLHVLVNNAGTVNFKRKVTVDGIEEMLAVNYLAAFLLTNLLLDTIKQSAPARIINIVGEYHRRGKIDFEDMQAEKQYDVMQTGSDRVLAKTIFSHELARRLEGTGVTVNCLHPGAVRTGIQKKLPAIYRWLAVPISALFFQSPDKAAGYVLYLASYPGLKKFTGKYFNKMQEEKSSEATYDMDLAGRLWTMSEVLTRFG